MQNGYSYVIDHPEGEAWIPEKNQLRKVFIAILGPNAFGRWRIVTRDNQVVCGYMTPQYKTNLIADRRIIKTLPCQVMELVRDCSQIYEFLYNILELSLYTDSTGKEKPEYIILRPDVSSTVFYKPSWKEYEAHSFIDINRPEPEFAKKYAQIKPDSKLSIAPSLSLRTI